MHAPPPDANEGPADAHAASPLPDETGAQTPGEAARSKSTALRGRASTTAARVKSSSVGTYWKQLHAVDFLNSSLVFAALALLCLLPFLTVLAAAAGGDLRRTIATRMGLNRHAAAAVEQLMSSGHRAVTTLSVVGAVWLVLGALGIASTLQVWYERVFDRPPPVAARRWASQAIWVAAFLAYLTAQVLIGRDVGSQGGHVLRYAAEFALALVFWTFSVYLLLLGEIHLRALVPTGVATAFCLTGLSVFSALFFSSSVISGDRNYGPAGVVTALLSYLIALGVCIHLGAVFGQMWNNRQHSTRPSDAGTASTDGPTDER